MSAPPAPQRRFRAACPQCGAPVDFASPASAFAICSFCRSTVVREGEALRRIGQSAELFDDHSPLRLGASGRFEGASFTLVGRLQMAAAEGRWNEWHALFVDGAAAGRAAWLSEDNGRYVLSLDRPLAEPVPLADKLAPGAPLTLDGRRWRVASVAMAHIHAAEGELPRRPASAGEFVVADLRNEQGEVATLDYADPARPSWSVGRSVALADLAMTGLAEDSEKSLGGRTLTCPNCGAPVELKLDSTKSVTCGQCHSVIDVSQGVGGDLAHYAQDHGSEPRIPLGQVGTLALGGAARPWQVVGYVERREVPESADDEQSFWREYLLYHRETGFSFLVDAEDGWSWATPITGAPEGDGDRIRWAGDTYRKLYDYTGEVTYVLGEFYWPVERAQRTFNSDYAGTGGAATKRLNREVTGSGRDREVVWSAGEALGADVVAKAFRLDGGTAQAMQRDAAPVSSAGGGLLAKLFLWAFIIVVVLLILRCSNGGSDCDAVRASYGESSAEYQQCLVDRRSSSSSGSGGSYHGYSSGGSHK